MRLDIYLTDNSLAKSRTFAKELIENGYVTINGCVAEKASVNVTESDKVVVTGVPYSYVSRGGVKLEHALKFFNVTVTGKKCLDIGSSTGGFTDCLLQYGAEIVYAVDSGKDQLDSKLIYDKRVISLESFNARDLDNKVTNGLCDVAVCDVSFISQTLIIPVLPKVLKPNGIYIGLIKPQFECGKEGLGKGGIVKNKKYHLKAIKNVIASAEQFGIGCLNLSKSPISGGDGNTEYLFYCLNNAQTVVNNEIIRKVVEI